MLEGEGVLLAAYEVQHFETEDAPVWVEAIDEQLDYRSVDCSFSAFEVLVLLV